MNNKWVDLGNSTWRRDYVRCFAAVWRSASAPVWDWYVYTIDARHALASGGAPNLAAAKAAADKAARNIDAGKSA